MDDKKEYGEFIPSYYGWIDLDEQKKIAKKLAKITEKPKKKK